MQKIALMVLAGFASLSMAATVLAADGKEVYKNACGSCHNMMKPKLGDKAAWEPLKKKGVDTLTQEAIKGKGAMPPKGGKASLSNADVKAAVEYMVEQAK